MKLRQYAIAIAFIWLLPAVGRAGIVIDHQPFPTGGPASDTDLIDPLSTLTAQQVADDFTLAVDAEIRHITWWGFYGSTATNPAEQPPASQTMRVRFYEARPGDDLPGNLIHEESFIDPLFAPTGRIIVTGAAPDEFKFDVDLSTPVFLSAATPYWLEIVQLGTMESHYRWEFSIVEQNGVASLNASFPDWRRSFLGVDLAFQLSIVPEPASGVFFALFVIGFICCGGRKRCLE